MSIPPMGRNIPPPPKKNKNKLWERYSKGEKLQPTYNTIHSKVIPPAIHAHKVEKSKDSVIIFFITFMIIMFTVSVLCLLIPKFL